MSSKSTTNQKPGESFAEWKERAFGASADETFGAVARNQYHVQAKLPAELYLWFTYFKKANNFTTSEGIQYVLYRQFKNDTNV